MKPGSKYRAAKGGTDLSIPIAPSARRSISAASNSKPAPARYMDPCLLRTPDRPQSRPRTPDVLAPPAAHRTRQGSHRRLHPLHPEKPRTAAAANFQGPSCDQGKGDGPCWHKRRITIPYGFTLAPDARLPSSPRCKLLRAWCRRDRSLRTQLLPVRNNPPQRRQDNM